MVLVRLQCSWIGRISDHAICQVIWLADCCWKEPYVVPRQCLGDALWAVVPLKYLGDPMISSFAAACQQLVTGFSVNECLELNIYPCCQVASLVTAEARSSVCSIAAAL